MPQPTTIYNISNMTGYQDCVGQDEAPSTAIVRVLSTISNTRPEQLPPLYDSIDPDALDILFSNKQSNGAVKFCHSGFRIRITSNGEIHIAPVED